MARALLERKLTLRRNGCAEFILATADDDAEIRRLLRENPTPGRIALSFEREPDYFLDALVPGETKQTIIARENGRIACMGSSVVRRRFVNGRPQRVGYLGGLRLDSACSGRFDIVRRGYRFFRELQSEAPADFYFTSIAGDNERARRFLERGLPGMPQYEFVGEFITVLLRAKSGTPAGPEVQRLDRIGDEFVSRLNEHNRQYQFSPCWTLKELRFYESLGLRSQDFMCVQSSGGISASAALWDQRVYKQTVIRGYNRFLAAARPALNVAARFFAEPGLPANDTVLSNALVSHLQLSADQSTACVELLAALSALAAGRGIELLTLAFASNDPRLATLRGHFRCREYLTRLYVVSWPGMGNSVSRLDNRVPAPEVALL